MILAGVQQFGKKGARIADLLPMGRSDDSVRNRWHRLQRKQVSAKQQCRNNNRMHPALKDPGAMPMIAPTMQLASPLELEFGSPTTCAPESFKAGDMWTAEED